VFVGGEFYYDDLWQADIPTVSTNGTYFLNGGTACLRVICDYLLDHGICEILLPSYLCPSILAPLEQTGMKWDYYQVNRDLSIDLDDLSGKLKNDQSIYLINYFGFPHSNKTISFMHNLSEVGITIIEDNAQAGFITPTIGEFAFNSIRKLAPYDGGYLTTANDIDRYLKRYSKITNRRLPVIRKYRKMLHPYLVSGIGNFDELDGLFHLSEKLYSEDGVIFGDEVERKHIEHLDWPRIKAKRRENYFHLLALIIDIPEIFPIFPALPEDSMPMGLPVYFSGVPRDLINDELGKAGIGLCIHWDDLKTDPRTNGNRLAVEMAGGMLTLQIDQRTSFDQLDYLAQKLMKAIISVRNSA
jgi:hypothetical protein